MLKAYKYELAPTEEQKQQLNGAFGSCRAVYNLALETKNRAYQAGKNLTCFDLIKQLPDLKEEFVWLKEVPSQSLQQAISNLDNAFTNFFKGRASFPNFKKKNSKQSFRIPISIRVNFETNCVRLPKYGDVKFYNSRKFGGDVKQATVSKTTTGRYFISILVEDHKNIPLKKEIKESTTIGIDLGLKHFAILSDGTKIENPRFLVKAQKDLKVQQRSLARKKKGSKRREKQKIVVAKLHEKVSNQRKDFLHKLSTQIVNEYDSIAIENLNVSGMIKNKNLAKHIADVSWGTFESYLKYKAEWYGKNILQIGRFEPSSKMCSCGKVNNQLKLSQREWVCTSCGSIHDRDILAANNIKKFGLGQIQANVKVKQ